MYQTVGSQGLLNEKAESNPIVNNEIFNGEFPVFGKFNDCFDHEEVRIKSHISDLNNTSRFVRWFGGKLKEGAPKKFAKIKSKGIEFDAVLWVDPFDLLTKLNNYNLVDVIRSTRIYQSDEYLNMTDKYEKLSKKSKELISYQNTIVNAGGNGYDDLFSDEIKDIEDEINPYILNFCVVVCIEINQMFFDGMESSVEDLCVVDGVNCFATGGYLKDVITKDFLIDNNFL